jgi:hypothetical protein
MQRGADVGTEELVAVEVAVLVPAGTMRSGEPGQELEAESQPEPIGPVMQEREIEPAAVPGDEDTGRKFGEYSIEFGDDRRLGTIEHDLDPIAAQRDGDDGSDRRVEAVDRGVGLDVEAIGEGRGGSDEVTLRFGCDSLSRLRVR